MLITDEDAFDSGVFISEEAANAQIAVPIALAGPPFFIAIIGFCECFPCEPVAVNGGLCSVDYSC